MKYVDKNIKKQWFKIIIIPTIISSWSNKLSIHGKIHLKIYLLIRYEDLVNNPFEKI